jgi:hypothetical protein
MAARHADATPSLDRAMEFAVAPGGPGLYRHRPRRQAVRRIACFAQILSAYLHRRGDASGSAMARLPFWGVLHCAPLP